MNALKLLMSHDLIRDALAFPDDVEILGIHKSESLVNTYEFIISRPDFPVVPEAGEPILAEAQIQGDYSKRPTTWMTMKLSWPV